MSEKIDFTYGPAQDGRMIAILSRGGHPQRPGSGTCEVLALELCPTWKAAKRWKTTMLAAKPWEKAND